MPEVDDWNRELLDALDRQARRLPWADLVAGAFLGVVLWHDSRNPLAPAWLALFVLSLLGRRYAARRPAFSPGAGGGMPGSMPRRIGWVKAGHFVAGAIVGSASLLFFPDLPFQSQALVSIVSLALIALARPGRCASATLFAAFAAPAAAEVALAWLTGGAADPGWVDAAIAALVVLGTWTLYGLNADSELLGRESVSMRRQNGALLAELRTMNAELARQRDIARSADRAKSRFLAAASHDLRQPLHALTLYAESLLTRPLDAKSRQIAVQIRSGIRDSLKPLLERLLDISRLDAGVVKVEFAEVESQVVLDQMQEEFDALAREAGGSLQVCRNGELTLWTDPVLLSRILRNLLENAIRHGQARGLVLSIAAEDGRALIRLSDDGPGIPEAEQGRVFEEFYQLDNPGRDRQRGLGLGLAIVRRLCRLLDIGLGFESTPGIGTRFTLSLPLLSARPEQRYESPASPGLSSLPGLRVLVVDDEAPVRDSTATLIRAWGGQAVCARDYDEAVARLDQQRFDTVLADHRLGDGPNGLAIVHYALRRQPGVRAFIISGDLMPESSIAAGGSGGATDPHGPPDDCFPAPDYRPGGNRWLGKPIDPAELHRALAARGPQADPTFRRPSAYCAASPPAAGGPPPG